MVGIDMEIYIFLFSRAPFHFVDCLICGSIEFFFFILALVVLTFLSVNFFKIKSPILMARIYCQYYLLGILTFWLIHSSFNSCVNFCKTVKFYLLNEFVEFLHTIYRSSCPFLIVYAFTPLSLIN